MFQYLQTQGVSWFPPRWSHDFFLLKGFLATVALCLVVYHMSKTWDHVVTRGTKGQIMRYLTLLCYTGLTAGGTIEQLRSKTPVYYQNLGNFVVVVLTIITMWVSIHEDNKREKKNEPSGKS